MDIAKQKIMIIKIGMYLELSLLLEMRAIITLSV
jgi:hypothetical protein